MVAKNFLRKAHHLVNKVVTVYNLPISEEKERKTQEIEKKFAKLVAEIPYIVNCLKEMERDVQELANRNAKERKEIKRLKQERHKYYIEMGKICDRVQQQKDFAILTPQEEKELLHSTEKKHKMMLKEKEKVDQKVEEFLIKQEELEVAIQDTNLAKSSYYRLTDTEMELFENQRPLILEGIEKYGSISLAIKNNARITMRASSIMHYANKHRQFKEDIEIAKQVFKDNLDATMVDRAINGTMNPVFQKGEYIGDYAVKDNKLLVEVAKAKIPETYNPRAYAAANPQSVGGTTINIVSFDGVDETKHGYARNIGVVKSVDDTGRVERITQNKKITDFYSKKDKAEILEAEVISDDTDNSDKV